MAVRKQRKKRHIPLPNTPKAGNPSAGGARLPNSTTPLTYPRRRTYRLPNSKVAVVKPAPRKRPVRGAALGEMVPCCVAEAVAASLRQYWRVTEEDVLRLHSLAAGRSGAAIEHILDAVVSHGLAGVRPAEVEEVMPYDPVEPGHRASRAGLILGIDQPGPHTVYDDGQYWWSWGEPWEPFPGVVISEAWSIAWSSA